MTTFQSVNSNLAPRDHAFQDSSMATQMALDAPRNQELPPQEESSVTTPTRHSFLAASKRALPTSPFSTSFPTIMPASSQPPQAALSRGDSHRSIQSTDSQDIDMDDSDEGDDASDTESIDDETGRPSKKKKGQRFFCADYPPCNLSFTRSEHLARHIRKHTGERPFQCHCARRFSRLDNLRQHAQTVHVNEEIPGDSLAATGTRFQRQIRTDRVRPPGARSRASTASSQGSHHGRGHSRNLSTSSVASTTSTLSTISSLSRDDSRRRPQPLMMAHDPSNRARLTIDTIGQSSPGIPTTPTSTAYSNGPGSPFGSTIGSPSSSRHVSLWDGRPLGRRLSVPSGVSPFQPSHPMIHNSSFTGTLSPSNASHGSAYSSLMASPTSSTYSFSRQESSGVDADWRRRTWHPSTYSNYPRPATSGLSYYQTPDAPRPAFSGQAMAAAGQNQRLPGIETFDQIPHRPTTPPRPSVGAMQIETPKRPPLFQGSSDRGMSGPGHRRGMASWDLSLHQNLTKLDIANGTPPKDAGQWGRQAIAEIQNVASASSFPSAPAQPSQSSQPSQPSTTTSSQEPQKRLTEFDHYRQPPTSQRDKRSGWYHAPPVVTQQLRAAQRTSPEDSSSSEGIPTPSASIIDYHPSIVHANGYIETNNATPSSGAGFIGYSSNGQQHAYTVQPDSSRPLPAPKGPDMSGLEALVAVATSEPKAQTTSHH